jgi:hypothetical protein
MGAIADLLTEIPLSAVLRERVKLFEQKYELPEGENSALKDKVAKFEQENAGLRARIPAIPSDDLSDDDKKMLTGLFHARNDHTGGPFEEPVAENDVNALARRLGMDPDTARRRSRRRASRRSWTGGRARRRSRWSGKGKA